jgi:uncharacterized protein YjbJ (UPF0337 family)
MRLVPCKDRKEKMKMGDLKTEGRIDQARGKIRSTWGDLTDDDFDRAKGDSESLIGRIKELTGDTVENIRSKLDELMGDGKEADTFDRS